MRDPKNHLSDENLSADMAPIEAIQRDYPLFDLPTTKTAHEEQCLGEEGKSHYGYLD